MSTQEEQASVMTRVPLEIKKGMQKVAREHNRTLSGELRHALASYVDYHGSLSAE